MGVVFHVEGCWGRGWVLEYRAPPLVSGVSTRCAGHYHRAWCGGQAAPGLVTFAGLTVDGVVDATYGAELFAVYSGLE